MDTVDIETLWRMVYQLQEQPVGDEQLRLQLNRICEIVRKGDTRISPADRSLLLGYIAYHYVDMLDIGVNCESELKNVLQNDPENSTAILYLGHLCFDRKDYAMAKMYLNRVDQQRYVAAGQQWRAFKIQELLLSCDLNLGETANALNNTETLLAQLRAADDVDCPVMLELVRTLVEKKPSLELSLGSIHFHRLCSEVISVIEQHGWTNALWSYVTALREIPEEKAVPPQQPLTTEANDH
jgi:hypothetical protein